MATPICAECRKLVNEPAVFAMGLGYHPACFWPNGVPSAWFRYLAELATSRAAIEKAHP